jgi:hypothetical protein
VIALNRVRFNVNCVQLLQASVPETGILILSYRADSASDDA